MMTVRNDLMVLQHRPVPPQSKPLHPNLISLVKQVVEDDLLLEEKHHQNIKNPQVRNHLNYRDSNKWIYLEYTVTAGNRISDAHGDIVVAHSGKSKADMNSGAAVTTAAAFMAGTAIMLL